MGVTRISIRERRIRVLKRKYQEFGTVKKTVLNKNDLKQKLRMKTTINHLRKLTETDLEKVTGEKNDGYNYQSELKKVSEFDLNSNFTNIQGGRPGSPKKGYEFNCNLCEKSFAFVQHIKIHMSSEHPGHFYDLPEKSLNMPKETQKIFNDPIENHELKQNVDGQIVCLTCHKTFVNFQGAKRHFKEMHLNIKRNVSLTKQSGQSYGRAKPKQKLLPIENDTLKCFDCDKTFSKRDSARKHYKSWHAADKNGNEFICTVCDEGFAVKYSLKQHVNDKHGLKLMTRKNTEDLSCQICKKICRSKSGLDSHMRWHTVWKQLEVTECGRVKCLCCHTTFSCIGGARSHYKIWHMADKNGNNFLCKVCNEEYEDQYSLKEHVKSVHGRPKEFKNKKLEAIENGRVKCLDCDKTYSSIETARSHYKFLHMTDKNDIPFFCNVCKKGFAIKDYLNRHMKIHFSPQMTSKPNQRSERLRWKELKPNKHGGVTCQNCKKDFSSMKSAKQHYTGQHMSKKIFKCKVCKKHLSNKANMIVHLHVVHGSTEGWMVIDVSPNKKLFKKCVIPLPPID